MQPGKHTSLGTTTKQLSPAITCIEALHLAEETINKGGIFAKNAKDKYRATNPALGKSTVINDVASSIEKAFKQGYSMRDASIIPDEAPKTVSGNNQNLIEPSDVIGFTAATKSEVVPGRAVTALTISHSPKGKNREQMDYFGSWGPQIKRDTPGKLLTLLFYYLLDTEIHYYSCTATKSGLHWRSRMACFTKAGVHCLSDFWRTSGGYTLHGKLRGGYFHQAR